jgi:hypothetical protein
LCLKPEQVYSFSLCEAALFLTKNIYKPNLCCTLPSAVLLGLYYLTSPPSPHLPLLLPCSLCRDAESRGGASPYGYSVVRRFCCCSPRCEAPDGVGGGSGTGAMGGCPPALWDNYTYTAGGGAGGAGGGGVEGMMLLWGVGAATLLRCT